MCNHTLVKEYDFNALIMHICMCLCMRMQCLQRPEDVRFPGAGSRGIRGPPDLGVSARTACTLNTGSSPDARFLFMAESISYIKCEISKQTKQKNKNNFGLVCCVFLICVYLCVALGTCMPQHS